jgi:hypothetical protein
MHMELNPAIQKIPLARYVDFSACFNEQLAQSIALLPRRSASQVAKAKSQPSVPDAASSTVSLILIWILVQ